MKRYDDWHPTETIHHEQGKGDPFAAAVRATRTPTPASDISATAWKKLGLISPAPVMVVGDTPGDDSPVRR